MRIAFMAYDFPNYTGGPIINARRILPEFVKRGHEVLAIIGFSGDCPNAKWLKTKDVRVETYNLGYTEKIIKQILFYLKDFNPDVFVPNISAQGAYAGYWVKKSGIPTIIAHRSDDVRNWCTAKTFGIKKWKWQSSGIVCVSEYLKAESLKLSKKELKVSVIPSGVPIPDGRTEQHSRKIKIIYNGRLVQQQKRIWETIKAFINLSKRIDNIEFTILGEGYEKENLINYVKKEKCYQRIKIKDKLTGEAYHKELLKHQIVVLLSDYEGIPGSLMDAMACGLVPVCFNFNGIEEIVKNRETGFVVNDRNNEFYKIIEELVKNSEIRNRISINAKELIKTKYSLDVAVDKWLIFFNILLSEVGWKKSIKIPKRLRLPTVPDCYKDIGDDVRFTKQVGFVKYIKQKIRLRTRIKAFLNG